METRTEKAIKGFAIAAAIFTYIGAVAYGDIMFLTVVQEAFPIGVLGSLAMVGAVMTAVSAITLPLALHYWLSPGSQYLLGLGFWVIDIIVLGLNSILAYAIATGDMVTLASWHDLSPATPLLAVVGWGLLFMADPTHKLRHVRIELQADLIDIFAEQSRLAAKTEGVYKEIQAGAQKQAREFTGLLTSNPAALQKVDNRVRSEPAPVPHRKTWLPAFLRLPGDNRNNSETVTIPEGDTTNGNFFPGDNHK